MPNLTWIKIAAVLAATVAGMYLKSVYDRAAEADALERKVEKMALAAAENDRKALAVETELQTVRLQAADFNRKWSKIRADQNRAVCLLDEPTVRLLKSASGDNPR